MSVAAIAHLMLPDSPYELWLRGELDDHVGATPEMRVEVVGGEIVVSPPPDFVHGSAASAIQRAIDLRSFMDASYPWRSRQGPGVDLLDTGEGYIPDLVVFHLDVEIEGMVKNPRFLTPDQLALVVEVTSKSNARNDRAPVIGRRAQGTKWTGYARAGVPFYLLVDRDPRRPGITLYGDPDRRAGRYQELHTWNFGEAMRLPAPFDIEVDTAGWGRWSD
ncbi:Uma2 family endonuclease [Kitasatospora sp. NPDC006697]|uniref:Uma2 family endonuclease n=1 Tax=Kitasatospora sp. NPDC006697 TaxID=3364020 RepID=UPI0036C6B89B